MSRASVAERPRAEPSGGADRTGGERGSNRRFAIGLARAFGGALIFSLPMLMTMEMWWLGFYMDPLRLAIFMLLIVPLLVGLSYYAGFEETFSLRDDLVDAFVAYAVGFVTGGVVLLLLSILEPGMSLREIVGKISLQAVPGSIGAMLAQSQLGGEQAGKQGPTPGYGGEIFLMAAGALFIAFNLAPTEEMVLIAYKMTEWHAIALAAASLLMMHAFVYSLEFRGQDPIPQGTAWGSAFLRFTVVGYAVGLLISVYVLWTFGRLEGLSPEAMVMSTIVLGFPAALGAAAARLIL